jgi:uncharacterized lipoprotein
MYKYLFQIKSARNFVFVSVLMGLSACSSVDNALDTTTGVKYSNNASVAVLKSPEGLVSPEYDMTFALPESGQYDKKPTLVDIRPPDLLK